MQAKQCTDGEGAKKKRIYRVWTRQRQHPKKREIFVIHFNFNAVVQDVQ